MRLDSYTIHFNDSKMSMQQFVGIDNQNVDLIETAFHGVILHEGNSLICRFADTDLESVIKLSRLMKAVFETYERLDHHDVAQLIEVVHEGKDERFIEVLNVVLTRTHTGKPIKPKTLGQKIFIDQVKSHDLTFASGPAGTGKTYIAVCYAVELLKQNVVSRIILTRPAVEAGENLGFLPGDLKEKVDPYLRPLYDALDDMLSAEKTQRLIDKGIIEIAPLAYMRGRTLDDAVVILDEAQNTTRSQMMMFLSRLGRNSKMIVTGDTDQIDLPKSQASGMKIAIEYLHGIPEIAMVQLSHSDIVRHPLVVKILKKFQEGSSKHEENTFNRR